MKRGMVATSQRAATAVGVDILRSGGNAVDAAIAVAACLPVCEPTTNGLGGDCFALVWDPRGSAGRRVIGINGSGRSPAALTRERFQRDAGSATKYPTRGWLPVTVPGQVAAWRDLHRRYGVLPFDRVIAPAIAIARDGFELQPHTAELWERSARVFGVDPVWGDGWREVFGAQSPRAGEVVRLPELARTLESVAASGGDSFYRGDIADAIVTHAAATGGLLTRDDLASHESVWVDPISMSYRGHRLWEIPPNGQGLAALVALGVLERLSPRDATGGAAMDAARLHRMIESIKLGFAVAHANVGDPAAMAERGITVEALLSAGSLDTLASRFDPTRAQDFLAGTPKPGGTVQFCTADASGMMVSFIQSNYTGFGSGVVIPHFGIAMQNRGACFTLEAGHVNELGPGKRPYHTIIPGFLTRIGANGSDEPAAAMGVMGGFMQPQGHVQVVSHLLDHLMTPQAALDMPRWQWMEGLDVRVEPLLPTESVTALQALGHQVSVAERADVAFGRGQIIALVGSVVGEESEPSFVGGSDFRADGCALAS